MRPPGITVLHPPVHPGLHLGHAGVFFQVDVLVFDAPSEPLDENVVHPTPAPVHADLHAPFLEPSGPFFTGELAALVGVEDLRHAACARLCTLQRQQAQAGVHRVAHRPAQDAARMPVHDGAQVGVATPHGHVGDVGAPHFVRPADLLVTQQVGMDAVGLVRDAGARLAIDGLQPHFALQPLKAFAVDGQAVVSLQDGHQTPAAHAGIQHVARLSELGNRLDLEALILRHQGQ
jgi:hypothetical protein